MHGDAEGNGPGVRAGTYLKKWRTWGIGDMQDGHSTVELEPARHILFARIKGALPRLEALVYAF